MLRFIFLCIPAIGVFSCTQQSEAEKEAPHEKTIPFNRSDPAVINIKQYPDSFPSGSYVMADDTFTKNGELFGRYGEIEVMVLEGNKINMKLWLCNGATAYNSGEISETLHFRNNHAMYVYEFDSCRVTFNFSRKGVKVVQEDNGYNVSCGFGHGVYADGFYRKVRADSSKRSISDQLIPEPK